VRTFSLLVCLAGCLGEATFTNPDLSGSVLPDLAQPSADMGSGDGGGTNCVMLNDCEKGCSSDPKPQMCIMNCRAMASASAVMKETALQTCFGQYCPQGNDMGTNTICTPNDMGAFSSDCSKCISNSQIAPANACTPVATPSECHQCNSQAAACVADK
jgi:hypothetical protein